MPNHVSQRLTLRGDPDIVRRIIEQISQEHPPVQRTGMFGDDLEYLPDPVELDDGRPVRIGMLRKDGQFDVRARPKQPDGTWGQWQTESTIRGVPSVGWKPYMTEAYVERIAFSRIIPEPPCLFKGGLSLDDQMANPNRNWYNWNITKWGTKWSAYETGLDDQGRITFQTAWSIPQPVLIELSWLFPEIELFLEAVDEGWCFWGTQTYKAGVLTEDLIVDGDSGEPKADPLLIRLEKELRGHDITKDEDDG